MVIFMKKDLREGGGTLRRIGLNPWKGGPEGGGA